MERLKQKVAASSSRVIASLQQAATGTFQQQQQAAQQQPTDAPEPQVKVGLQAPGEFSAAAAVVASPSAARLMAADVAVQRRPEARPAPAAPADREAGVAVLEPVTVPFLIVEPFREAFLKILRRDDRELVGAGARTGAQNRSRS